MPKRHADSKYSCTINGGQVEGQQICCYRRLPRRLGASSSRDSKVKQETHTPSHDEDLESELFCSHSLTTRVSRFPFTYLPILMYHHTAPLPHFPLRLERGCRG